jgi:hypothetical protein
MSIEQEIRDLTIAINGLTYAILNKPVPQQVDIHELEAIAEAIPVVEMTDEEALAIVSKEKAKPAKEEKLSKDDLQAQCMKLVRANRAIKAQLQSWLKDRGSESLANLDEQHLPDFKAFIDAIEVPA